MKKLGLILLVIFLVSPAKAQTYVWGLYGWGDNAFGSSRGIDQIAVQARRIPGVVFVHVYNYWQTQQVANEIMAAKGKIVIYGYSCGANSPTTVALGLLGHKTVDTIAGIQESLWCGGYPLYGNVKYGQETYAGCIITLGFGCKKYQAGQGFAGKITLIRRPDLHPFADTDQDAQNDVLTAIAATAGAGSRKYRAPIGGWHIREVVRYHGQRP